MDQTKRGLVSAIYIAHVAGGPTVKVDRVRAIEGQGLEGDRYATGEGSWNKVKGVGHRQVTLAHGLFFPGSGFHEWHSRRNIITSGIDLTGLIGWEYEVGEAVLYGEKACEPCDRPSTLAGSEQSFEQVFLNCGGLISRVIRGGLIAEGDLIIPIKKVA